MRKILSFLLFTTITLTVFAQKIQVKGTVTSSQDGLPLIGVNVLEKGTSTGTISDLDGRFTLSVAPNIEPVVNITVKAVPFEDDMESDDSPVVYQPKEMEDTPKTKRGYDNPLPVGINTSSKVYLYEKTDSYYSNLLIPNAGYKYDLTDQHTIKMKVYLPSYNDYTTEGLVADDQITNKHLQKTVAVKLQDSSLGDNAWSTQAEISMDNLPTDTWVELTFDFSSYKLRTDFDSIVLQFGGEGHSMPGLFFFDDLTFE